MAVTTLTQPRYLIRTATDPSQWTARPTWLLDSCEHAACAVGSASFRVPVGDIARVPAAPAAEPELPTVLVGQLVEVGVEGGPDLTFVEASVSYGVMWAGIITRVEREESGAGAWWLVEAEGLAAILHRKTVRFVWALANATTPRLVREPLVFNEWHGGDASSAFHAVWGHSVRVFDRRLGAPASARVSWEAISALRHIFAANLWAPIPADEGGALAGFDHAFNAIGFAGTTPLVPAYDPRGKTLAQCLDDLLLRYGFWWSVRAIDLHSANPKLVIDFGPSLASAVTVGSTTIPASTHTETSFATPAAHRWPLRVSYDATQRYDSVVVRGGGRLRVLTLGCWGAASTSVPWANGLNALASLEPDWTNDEETQANAWLDTGSSGARPERLGGAWRRFRLRDGWDGRQWNQAATIGLPDQLDYETSAAYGEDGLPGTVQRLGGVALPACALRLVPTLPWGEASAPADPLAPGYRGPQIFLETNANQWRECSDWGVWVDHARGPAIELDDGMGGRTIRDALRSGRRLLVTIGVASHLPLEVQWVRPGAQRRTHDDAQTLVLDRDDCWEAVAVAGTVWRLSGTALQTLAADLALRNDLERLRASLAAARAVYAREAGIVWSLRAIGEAPLSWHPTDPRTVGRLVPSAWDGTQARAIGAPITRVSARIVEGARGTYWETTYSGSTLLPDPEVLR